MKRFSFILGKKGKPNSSKVVRVDINATYYEYHMVIMPQGRRAVTVSSDDLLSTGKFKSRMYHEYRGRINGLEL